MTDYSYELFTTSILTKSSYNGISNSKINLTVKFYYQKSHLNSYYLMCAIYYKIIGDKKNEAKYSTLFSLDECCYSYEEFIKLLYQVYLYSNAKNPSLKKNQNKIHSIK